jgi:hypothetical protein
MCLTLQQYIMYQQLMNIKAIEVSKIVRKTFGKYVYSDLKYTFPHFLKYYHPVYFFLICSLYTLYSNIDVNELHFADCSTLMLSCMR